MFEKIVGIATSNKVAILTEGIVTGVALAGLVIAGTIKIRQNQKLEKAAII